MRWVMQIVIWVLYIAVMLVVLLWMAAVFTDDLSTVDVMPLVFLVLLIFTAGNILLTLKDCIIYRRQNQYSMKIAAQLKLEADVERSISGICRNPCGVTTEYP